MKAGSLGWTRNCQLRTSEQYQPHALSIEKELSRKAYLDPEQASHTPFDRRAERSE